MTTPMQLTAAPALKQSPVQGSSRIAPDSNYVTGILLCLAATILFGLMFPVITSALAHLDPFTFTSLRYMIAALASLVLLLVMEGKTALQPRGESIVLAWLLGTVGFAGFGFLVFLGQQLAGSDGALMASIMAATQPMLGVLIGSIARRILPPRYTLLFVVLSFCGVAIVVTQGDISALLKQPRSYGANALILLGMVCWLVYTFSASYFTQWSTLKYTTITMWLGLTSIVAINLSLLAGEVVPMPSAANLTAVIPHLLYMGLIASFVGVLCWNLGNRILTPLNGVLFMDVVPITAFGVSALTGVVPTSIQIVGACITGTAVILNGLYLRSRAKRPAPA
jgi:drug/metabolite transporter (DMT)-like permease